MSEIKWKALLNYKSPSLGHKNYTLYLVPVAYFSVNGKAVRAIALDGADLANVVSELEQSRSLKNLTVDLEVTENLDWLFDILEISGRDLPLSIELFVEGRIKKTLTHAFKLSCEEARIAQPQETSRMNGDGKRTLRVRLAFQKEADLIHGSLQGGRMVEEQW